MAKDKKPLSERSAEALRKAREKKDDEKEPRENPKEEPAAAQPSEMGDSENKVSLQFFLKEDGTVDVERMRSAMKDRIGEVLPKLQDAFGEKTSPSIAVPVIPEQYVSTLYDIVGSVEVLLFGAILKLDRDIAHQCFTYSKIEKEKLVPPTAIVLNKHLPDWLLKYKDEFALAALILMMTTSKIQMAKALTAAKQAIPTRQPTPAPAPEPMPAPAPTSGVEPTKSEAA
jgi:hypothetical protein